MFTTSCWILTIIHSRFLKTLMHLFSKFQIRLANPNRLSFEGLEHLLPRGLLKASLLQKSGVTNAMENFLIEEQKNINQNLKAGMELFPNLDNPQNVNFLPIYKKIEGNIKGIMSTQEFESKLTNWVSDNEVIQNLDNPQKVSSTLSTQERLDQIKTMASNTSMDESRAVDTEGAGRPVGPNRTMASNMSMDENMGVDTGGARGPPVGASGTGVWCNGVWFPTFGETIEDLDDFINPSMDKNQESNDPIMETFLKNGDFDSEVTFNPRKVSSTLPTQNHKGMDQLTENKASSMSMGPKAIKKTKNVAMAGILRQAATRSPRAGVENRADGSDGAGGGAGAKGTRIIQDLNPKKVSSTLSIQERLDQIKTMASNMSMDENRAVGNEGTSGPVGPNRTGGSSGILKQAATRSPSASVENKALGLGGVGGAKGAKATRVIFVPHQIKTMSSNMSLDENRAVGTEGTSGPVGPNRTGGSSTGILRQTETRSPSANVENKALGPGAASAADFAKRVKATPDFGLHLRLRDGE